MKYILLPFVAWVLAGCTKFAVNYLRHGAQAKRLIGYGGFPSTHTTVLSSVVFFAGFNEGFCTSVFSIGLGALLILIMVFFPEKIAYKSTYCRGWRYIFIWHINGGYSR